VMRLTRRGHPRSFDKDVKDVIPWERKLAEVMKDFMFKWQFRHIGYEKPEEIELQKKGVDWQITSETGDWEGKFRSKFWRKDLEKRDILLELVSVVESDKLGWLYTSKADAICYCWLNRFKTGLMPVGYIILIKKLRETRWYRENFVEPLERWGIGDFLDHLNYRVDEASSVRRRSTWTTKFVCPPVMGFPKGILIPFDPTVGGKFTQLKIDPFSSKGPEQQSLESTFGKELELSELEKELLNAVEYEIGVGELWPRIFLEDRGMTREEAGLTVRRLAEAGKLRRHGGEWRVS